MAEKRNREEAKKLKSDKEIKHAQKLRAFERQETLLDAITLLSKASIFIIPTIALLAIAILGIRYIYTGNWESFEYYTKQLVILVAGYIIAYLQKNGIGDKK